MENPHTELLDIRIDPDGAIAIKKASRIGHAVLLIGILYALVMAMSLFVHIAYVDPERFRRNFLFYLEVRIRPFYAALYLLFFLGQIFLYFRFARQMALAVHRADGNSFNEAFNLLYRSGVLFVINLALSILYGSLDTWVNYNLLNNK